MTEKEKKYYLLNNCLDRLSNDRDGMQMELKILSYLLDSLKIDTVDESWLISELSRLGEDIEAMKEIVRHKEKEE